MAASVYDLAVALTIMAGVDPNDQITRLSIGRTPAAAYESWLKPGVLKGKRIGVLRDLFKTGAEHEPYTKLILDAIEALKKEGAVIIDPVSTGTDLFAMTQNQSLGNFEYKWAFNAYLAARGPNQPFYSLKDLLASGKFHERLKKNYTDSEAAVPMEQSAEYAGKYRNRAILKKLLEELIAKFDLDALVYPVRSGPLPAAGTW